MSKHTPGPWEATQGSFPDGVAIAVVDDWHIVVEDTEDAYIYDAAADARLIAAAPDLLLSLAEMVELFIVPSPQTNRDIRLIYARAVEAIERATGHP